jgi:hypothetical protein
MTEVTNTPAFTATNTSDAKEVKLVAAANKAAEAAAKSALALSNYLEERAREEAAANIPVGTRVGFKFGRAENRKDYEGEVIAVVETPTGKLLKVLAGTGAELRVYDVPSKQATIVSVEAQSAPEADAEAPVALDPVADAGALNPDAGAAGAVDVDALLAQV